MSFNNIAVLIRTARLAVEPALSQTDLSRRLGYKNGQFISNMERGLCSLPMEKIEAAATILKITSLSICKCMVEDYRAKLTRCCEVQTKEMFKSGGIIEAPLSSDEVPVMAHPGETRIPKGW